MPFVREGVRSMPLKPINARTPLSRARSSSRPAIEGFLIREKFQDALNRRAA
jgi:hypothetical protein